MAWAILTEGVPVDKMEELRWDFAEDPAEKLKYATQMPGSVAPIMVAPGVLASGPIVPDEVS